MARVLVLGAGFGGIAAATRLRSLVGPAHEIVLVDRRTDFVMGLRKTWAIVGSHPVDEGRRTLADLRQRGIEVRTATVDAIDPAARRARLDGEWLEADALVVALGADQAVDAVPGLAEHAINAWDRANAVRAHDALAALHRGRLLVGVFGTPYACPPGPFELALLAQEALRARGADVAVEVFGPMPVALPVVGADESAKLEHLLDDAGIPFHRGRRATAVEPGTARFADGSALDFDLLLAVPPHRCPQVLVDAGLAPAGGWVSVDPATLTTAFPSVYAVGDATAIVLAHGLPLPKAGLFAEDEGYAVAERIASELAGSPVTGRFAGVGACFAEVGRGLAVQISGRFLADPPEIAILGPSPEYAAGKAGFERERLTAWFGG